MLQAEHLLDEIGGGGGGGGDDDDSETTMCLVQRSIGDLTD